MATPGMISREAKITCSVSLWSLVNNVKKVQ